MEDESVNDLAELISKLAIELSETPPDTELYEQRGEALADWLNLFASLTPVQAEWTVDAPESDLDSD